MDGALDRLTVVENRLVAARPDAYEAVRLRGINRSGFQHKPSLAAAGMADPQAELRAWRDLWAVDIVRFPLALDSLLASADYRADLDRVVDAADEARLYLVLEIHGTTKDLGPKLLPDGGVDAWRALAARYGARAHVLFDLFNEPHDVAWSAWRAQARDCARAIRDAGAGDTLLVVGGLGWSYDLTPLADPRNRLTDCGPVIYAAHPYPFKSAQPHREAEWERYIGAAADEVPVLIGEFGADASGVHPFGFTRAADAIDWLRALLAWIDDRQLSALAWSGGDMPQLTLGTGGGPVWLPGAPPDPATATDPFGAVVRAWLRAAREEPAERFV